MDAVKQLELSIQPLPTSSLKNYSNNARTHSRQQKKQLARSILENGFINPVIIDSTNTIIMGHARVEAAKMIGMEQVPTIRLEYLTPEQIIALRIADNKISENAGWDTSMLAIELQHLLTIDADFDLTATGFEIPEIDQILTSGDTDADTDDVFELEQNSNPVSESGDLWILGKHRIFCGNAIEEHSYLALMGAKRAAVVFVDPPYNVRIGGLVAAPRDRGPGSGKDDLQTGRRKPSRSSSRCRCREKGRCG